jgi:hypothetical protein
VAHQSARLLHPGAGSSKARYLSSSLVGESSAVRDSSVHSVRGLGEVPGAFCNPPIEYRDQQSCHQ